MKPLKARGISKETGEMVYGQVITGTEPKRMFIIPNGGDNGNMSGIIEIPSVGDFLGFFKYVEIKPETLGYATGVENKVGQEFYDGDIIRDTEDYEIRCGTVRFDKREAMFVWSLDNCWNDFSYVTNTLEVIGNIHQNKELLG